MKQMLTKQKNKLTIKKRWIKIGSVYKKRRRMEKQMKISTKTVVSVGMFTAVLAVLSILKIPMPSGVPITLQTFAMALCGYVLGAKKGTASTIIYILVGAVGVPVYAGMTGGVSCLFGYTGGFLWGFIFLTLLSGISLKVKNKVLQILLGVAGLAVCHLLGTIWYAVVASTTIWGSFLLVSVPYLVKDVISVVGAYFVAIALRKALHVANLLPAEA